MCFKSELVWVNASGVNPTTAYLYPPGVPAGKAVTQEKSKCPSGRITVFWYIAQIFKAFY